MTEMHEDLEKGILQADNNAKKVGRNKIGFTTEVEKEQWT